MPDPEYILGMQLECGLASAGTVYSCSSDPEPPLPLLPTLVPIRHANPVSGDSRLRGDVGTRSGLQDTDEGSHKALIAMGHTCWFLVAECGTH